MSNKEEEEEKKRKALRRSRDMSRNIEDMRSESKGSTKYD